jgi:acetyl/propionyl-CoA carboxylase alpha subunit/acetyl-CoA carboxylase carboxyltransferase component
MTIRKLLIANRGEIAIRIARAAADLDIETVAVFSPDDADSRHRHVADHARELTGAGAPAYLDIDQIVAVAQGTGCDAVHPGYGFLSENPDFARACVVAGLVWVGPNAELLALFGDKVRARQAARDADVPVLPGTDSPTSLAEARAFFDALPAGRSMIIKALAGGGGRGVRIVRQARELDDAFARCTSEARAAFGNGDVYVEQLLERARHIEVQIVGDHTGRVIHLFERDCTVQRRHQKIIEVAPSPVLNDRLRTRITDAAVMLAGAVGYNNVGTFEFLVDVSDPLSAASPFAFIEANARLQVEHTVTEAVTGVDLVATQLQIASGATLDALGLVHIADAEPRGFAIQARINMETMTEDGSVMPSGGTLAAFDPPTGPGIRVDTFGYSGYRTSPRFDSLLAKVIAHSPSTRFDDAVKRCYRALSEFRIDGVATNISFLQSVLLHPAFTGAELYTRFVDEHIGDLLGSGGAHKRLYAEPASRNGDDAAAAAARRRAGARLTSDDPLAVLTYGQAEGEKRRSRTAEQDARAAAASADAAAPAGTHGVYAPMQGTVIDVQVSVGDAVVVGQTLAIMEAMKMEHEVKSEHSGHVRRIDVAHGDVLYQGSPLLYVEPGEVAGAAGAGEENIDLDYIRPDLAQIVERRAYTLDANRPQAVARRRAKQQRTARENIEDLCDPDSFVEYGPLAVAAQAARRSLQELLEKSPADGMITGVGTVNGALFAEPVSRCAVLAYDYTVFAGTQGQRNHRKTDRMIQLAEDARLPLVLFAEGGGGRPGDTERAGGGTHTFASFPRLSALVPLVGITSGRCFAGNASLLGCCDVIIATADSNIGMGGPAMIEGGGLGVFAPEDIGPMSIQTRNGVVDVAVADEAEAVRVAKQYLSYFQGPLADWEANDQRTMRRIIPENRLRVYQVRDIIETLADKDTVLELRKDFGLGMVTALVRVEGRPLGIIANNPMHLGGAIDADGADKASRFMQLCDAFDVPLLYLCDTPGIMVGPEVERTALVRHSSRMFVTGANVTVPFFTIVLRKAYGLGAIAMAGGSYFTPYFTVAWPTGEFHGMGIEGSIKLGYREDLAKIEDPVARKAKFDEMVARAYEHSKAVHSATNFSVDDTIDPAESRRWVASLLKSVRPPAPRTGKKRPSIDTW